MGDDQHWQGTCTLEEYVYSLLKKRMTDSEEFHALIRIYGRERLKKIWKEFKLIHDKRPDQHE